MFLYQRVSHDQLPLNHHFPMFFPWFYHVSGKNPMGKLTQTSPPWWPPRLLELLLSADVASVPVPAKGALLARFAIIGASAFSAAALAWKTMGKWWFFIGFYGILWDFMIFMGYTLWLFVTVCYWKWWFLVGLSMKHGHWNHSYVTNYQRVWWFLMVDFYNVILMMNMVSMVFFSLSWFSMMIFRWWFFSRVLMVISMVILWWFYERSL